MQGFNRNYPANYDPKDPQHKGNLNRLAGKAPVIRFEMPFNIWCLHCDSHIAQGVRFNAHKQKTGNYFTSPIYSFTMKCHLCSGVIIIATNPKDTCYDVLSGAKKKAEEWNALENGTFEYNHTSAASEEDPLYKLEKDATQKTLLKSSQSHISELLDENERQWSDPYAQSQKLRRTFRHEKKVLREAEQEREAVQERHGLGLEILQKESLDTLAAKSIEFDYSSRGDLRNIVHDNVRSRRDPFSGAISNVKRIRQETISTPTEPLIGIEKAGTTATRLVSYDSGSDAD